MRELRLALADGWRIHAVETRYAAVGGWSYHWVVRDGDGRRWFVTVDDLDVKGWLSETRAAVLDGPYLDRSSSSGRTRNSAHSGPAHLGRLGEPNVPCDQR